MQRSTGSNLEFEQFHESMQRGVDGRGYSEFLTTTVSQGPYDFVVIEQGTVESARNTELRCQVLGEGG